MTNLLPPEELREVRHFYRTRFLTVGSFVATICAIIALIALMPSYLVLRFDSSSVEASSPEFFSNTALDQDEFRTTQDRLKQLAPIVHATSSLIDTVMRAIDARPKGILIDHISFSAGNRGTPTIDIAGVSGKREAINAYYETLKSDTAFKSVAIPVEDLVGTNDGIFTITLVSR